MKNTFVSCAKRKYIANNVQKKKKKKKTRHPTHEKTTKPKIITTRNDKKLRTIQNPVHNVNKIKII